MASFLTSILNAITRWTRGERFERAPVESLRAEPLVVEAPVSQPAAPPDVVVPTDEVDRLRSIAEDAARERDRFRALVETVPAVVWGTSGDRLTFISGHVTRMFGYTVEECLDTPDLWRSIVRTESDRAFPCTTKDGRTIWCTSVVDGDESGMRGVIIETEAPPVPEVVAAHEVESAEEEARSASPDLRRKQVLVVHREQEALEFISGVLQQCGAKVTTVKSAAEAILALLQHHDLIITEVGVSVAEGVTLAQQLRQANGNLPAIVLRKPVDAGELAVEIAQALTR